MNSVLASVVAITLVTGFVAKAPKPAYIPDSFEQVEKMSRDQLSRLPDMRIQLGVPLSETLLQSYNKVALRLMRNSIFAQYGYPFTVKWIADYFGTRSWYHPGNFSPEMVSAVDSANARLIQQYEEKNNPLMPGDRIAKLDQAKLSKLPNIQAPLNKPVDESALKAMSKRELKILRNSIYAQYGREFKTPWLQKYFDTRPWYKRGSYAESMLTPIDRNNVALILRYENAGAAVAEQTVLQLGYCEKESGMEIERYVFKPGHVLQYIVESQNPYGRSSDEGTLSGQWRAASGGIEYRLADDGEWEMLQVDSSTHACR